MYVDRREAVKRIKAALKKKTGKTWSVHSSRGTAWITVEAPKKRRVSHRENPAYVDHGTTPNEPHCLEYVNKDGENYFTPLADCKELIRVFGLNKPAHHYQQGLSISLDSREFYVEWAESFPEELESPEILSVQTERDNGALYEFSQLVKPGDAIEYSACSDGSAALTAIRNNRRAVTITFEYGKPDGVVYDISKINKSGHIVYPRGEN